MLTLYVIVGICILFQAERGLLDSYFLIKLFRKLKKSYHARRSSKPSEKRVIYVLIPVLAEQLIIEKTISNICNIKQEYFEIHVAIITTEREAIDCNQKQNLSTEELIRQSLHTGTLARCKDRIHIFRETNLHGNMATQLNFAIKELSNGAGLNTYYLVYNADSVISETTFMQLSILLEKYPHEEFAVQQPCAYVKKMHPSASNFLNALSLYQSWYCLAHESRLVYKYGVTSSKRLNNKNNLRLGIVVGHGSGMTLNINNNNGGYPADLLTEDLTFGFILSANGVPILSLPALELADVPEKFTSFIKQKSIWFWNYLGYLSCFKKTLDHKKSIYQASALLVQGIGAGAYWFASALFILIPLAIGAASDRYWIIIISLFSTFLFCIVPQYIILKNLPGILHHQGFYETAKSTNAISFMKILPSLIVILLTDSMGPWIATVKGILYLFSGTLPQKNKTED